MKGTVLRASTYLMRGTVRYGAVGGYGGYGGLMGSTYTSAVKTIAAGWFSFPATSLHFCHKFSAKKNVAKKMNGCWRHL